MGNSRFKDSFLQTSNKVYWVKEISLNCTGLAKFAAWACYFVQFCKPVLKLCPNRQNIQAKTNTFVTKLFISIQCHLS